MTALRTAILAAADAIEAAREPLCELDARTGDGDHGVTMTIAARSVRGKLGAVTGADAAGIVRAAAMGMASVGGAIGPIYAGGLLAIARELEARRGLAPGSGPDEPLATIAACAGAALQAVTGLGHAKVGDKTVVDALAPVVDELQRASSAGRSVRDALEAARAAARRGADSTVEMVATIGRSSRFGEASRGTADPGASSFALLVDVLVANALRDIESASDEVR